MDPVATPSHADVLELRVHGVNNTTAPSLLDLRPGDVELVAGDKLGSFWRPTAAALSALEQGQRGYVPPGIVREAYSWGGMVRTTPDLGSAGVAGMVAGAVARVFYALILPFSLANAAQWSWRLSPHARTERGVRRFAGATRLFGVLLTLLFTCTAASLALDIGALQCAADATLCGPVASVFESLETWTAGQRLALFALAPVAGVLVLWILSVVARLRYDVLPGMASHTARGMLIEGGADAGVAAPRALLAQPGFWSNRATLHLARLHLAAAILLTSLLTAAHAAMTWHTSCTGLGIDAACLGDAPASASFWVFAIVALVSATGVLVSLGLAVALPTTAIQPEEEGTRTWPDRGSRLLTIVSIVVFAVLLVALLFDRSGSVAPARLYGAGATPLIIVSAAAAIAAWAVFWRPRADRRHTAWHGCGPAVFMTLALAVATATSSIVVVTAGDWLNGAQGATALVRDAARAPGSPVTGLAVSSCWVSLGAGVLSGLVVALLWLAVVVPRRRDVTARAGAWGAPTSPADLDVPRGGVLPPSPATLFARIAATRRLAARVHLAEPVGGIVTGCLGAAVVFGGTWAWAAYAQGVSLWAAVPSLQADAVRTFLAVSLPALAWIGVALVALLAVGAATKASRPLGLVWDIVCYLPRTGHPFGPPSYAERAVPEIAGRLVAWLDGGPERRAVLSAHSMGGVLAVSALGVLASAPSTRPALARISLLTFGIQLRAFFGRMLPELLGPDVLGTEPALAPRLRDADPWSADFRAQGGERGVDAAGLAPASTTAPASAPATTPAPATSGPGRLRGTIVPPDGVRWVSLWRPTDYLGFPAVSTARADAARGFRNEVDRVAEELDLSGYMVEVGTHGEYYRVPAYTRALTDLLA